ncbi:hypothetical protein M2311_005699 [Rhizobium leguminosarum]|uniref:hypothetical protein n=1 Tax=Rhizobium leguminosarum TaxID=384 RepID=UPI0024750308|nr:hypothetical protein [Rhizobium leguminosarum]MDH6275599.1 hypothetical protein [Rhizobium leguminosarum]
MTNFALCHHEMPVLGGLLQRHIDWLRACGVPMVAIVRPEPMRLAHGYKAHDGRFDHDPSGPAWLVFPEPEDCVFWEPRTGALATWNGRAFALGESMIDNAATYAFGFPLRLYASPIHWLQGKRDGCVVLDWSLAFDRLRHSPRIAVAETLRPKLKQHLQPPRLPEILVMCEGTAA